MGESKRSEQTTGGRRQKRFSLSIQSKLLIMLLGVSLVTAGVVGAVGFVNARESLREAAYDQLTSIREMRTEQIERAFATIQTGAQLDSRNLSAQTASKLFNEGFAEAQTKSITPEQQLELEAWYSETFVPELEKRSGEKFDAAAFLPQSTAGRYLQYHYTSQFADFDDALAMTDAGDGSAWSAARERFHDYFQRLIESLSYEDAMLLDTEGNVVYSAYSGIELGTNVNTGPFRNDPLAAAYRDVMATNSVNAFATTDFERYLPSLNVPTIWVVSPVGNEKAITGAFAAQIPMASINTIMTGGESWKQQGLGNTGEVYLAGDDEMMRSISRRMVEDPDGYAQAVISNGTATTTAERMEQIEGTVLLQPVKTFAVERALRGETGTTTANEYIGGESLVAYAPVEIDGLNWVVVARIDSDEAFAPVYEFTRNLVISTLALLLAVSLLSLVLAQVFTRPVRQLADAVRRVAGGDLDARVPDRGHDEFGDLGRAFNDMSSSLSIKQDLIEEQRKENERLLHTLMPEAVAKRYRDGEETISQDHQDVSVVYAELVGFDDFAAELDSEQELASLNGLMRSFDEAAERIGVEKVRTLRGGYLASCGLIVPRVDNVRRAVEFALELRTIVERFNAQHGASVALRAGVDAGTVTSGLIGRSNMAYDLWGDAVSLAHRVQVVSGLPGIFVSEHVHDRLQDTVVLAEAGTIDTRDGAQTVWRVE